MPNRLDNVKHRRHAAYWYAVGCKYEASAWHRTLHSTGDKYPDIDESTFAEWAAAQAAAYYDEADERFHLASVPDQWTEYLKEVRDARA